MGDARPRRAPQAPCVCSCRAPGGRAGNAAPTRAGREEASVSASAGASWKVVAGRSGAENVCERLFRTESPSDRESTCESELNADGEGVVLGKFQTL